MPLLDHFHPPVAAEVQWQSFHSGWAYALAVHLNQHVLSQRYRATHQTRFGVSMQVDVATLDVEEKYDLHNGATEAAGGVATAVWAPPKATRTIRCNLTDLDVLEVRVVTEQDGRLVAAIELVSPANKDRPETRAAFVSKVAGYLQEKVGVVIVDVVTDRQSNMHTELMQLLGADENTIAALDSELYAAAYRAVGKGKRARLEMWLAPLVLGKALPLLPLWLASQQAVPLDLEPSYATVCKGLRIT